MTSSTPSDFNEPVFIGLGSNIGDKTSHLQRALAYIGNSENTRLIATSTSIETAPWGKTDQPEFLNAVAEIRTVFSPAELLDFLKTGETLLGRTPGERWGPRIIDMDILIFGQRVINNPSLIIPHREMTHRRFVLAPLLELCPDLNHPECGTRLADFLNTAQV